LRGEALEYEHFDGEVGVDVRTTIEEPCPRRDRPSGESRNAQAFGDGVDLAHGLWPGGSEMDAGFEVGVGGAECVEGGHATS
jgi:hypothetical protein